MNEKRTRILVVGGGPVGLALAIELGWRGIECVLVERRDGSIPLPKMNGVNARTMEFCRRWGISDRVRSAGWPQDFPRRIHYETAVGGHRLAVIDFGSDLQRKPSETTPEHFQRCPQTWFDPLLRELATSMRTNTLLYRTRLESFEDQGDRVVSDVTDLVTGAKSRITSDYVVACDGAKSGVRDTLGIDMAGSALLSYEINVYFECESVFPPGSGERAVMTWLIGPQGMWGALSAIDGRKLWRLWLSNMREDTDLATFDAAGYVRAAIGADRPFKLVGTLPWSRQQRVANQFRKGRVFLCGDALHNLTPTGGFGMNTGIQDAVDLAWKLEGVLAGWADARLLDSYEIERRPVAVRNVNEATFTFAKFLDLPRLPALLEDSPAGEAARRAIGRHIEENEFIREFQNEGIVLGYRYDPSPIVVPDGTPAPEDCVRKYVPTARPGSRAPHAWLADGRSTLDLFGRGFVLLRLGDEAPPAQPISDAAAARRVPLRVMSLKEPEILRRYERRLVLVRPDGHVAWRADAPPADPLTLIDTVRGALQTPEPG
jgi:2-polyprenyl-6-methoxyphenol hydroxylase-like FAD-dependent oxidoreductase